MQIGLVGLSNSGKTTLYQLLTGVNSLNTQGKSNRGVVRVPDARIDFLANHFKPRKTTYAVLEAVDIPGLIPGQDRSSISFLQAARDCDLLVHVIQAFNNPDVPHIDGDIDPMRDFQLINYELLLSDLDQVCRRLERIRQGKRKKENAGEEELLESIKTVLESEKPISSLNLDPEQELIVRNYQFLTAKPFVVVINVDEDDLAANNVKNMDELRLYCQERAIPVQILSARIELEISQLEGEEKEIFLKEMGIEKSGLEVVTRLIYERLNLISFFTVGEDEVKAWTIQRGTNARKAAGKIHSDIEKGFIRAEVVSFDAFKEYGSMAAAREAGLLRLEGKDYIVEDGDIIHFRFNV